MISQDNYKAFISKTFVAASIVLALLCWALLTFLLTPFTFTLDPFWKHFWAAFTAFPIVGTFYLATHMFWLVVVEYKRSRSAL